MLAPPLIGSSAGSPGGLLRLISEWMNKIAQRLTKFTTGAGRMRSAVHGHFIYLFNNQQGIEQREDAYPAPDRVEGRPFASAGSAYALGRLDFE